MTETQQQSATNNQIPYQIGANPYTGSIVLITSVDESLAQTERVFRSQRILQDGTLASSGNPLLNDYGVSCVMGQIQAIIRRDTIMGNLSETDIPMLCDFLGDTLAIDLMQNSKAYGIRDITTRYKVYFIAISSAYLCMKRAFEEGERRFWKGSTYEAVIRQQGDSGSNQNWIGKIFNWGKK